MSMMSTPTAAMILLGLTGLALFHKPIGLLCKLLCRSTIGFVVLLLFNQIGKWVGITLGVNLVNAVILGLLGVPGFGLLLMLRWLLA